jgi:PBP1b-binding outer membrane lipoprotein LpoB
MKKLFAMLVVAGMVFISCNPKTEEVADDATAQEQTTEQAAPAQQEQAAPAPQEEVPAEAPAETPAETPAQ